MGASFLEIKSFIERPQMNYAIISWILASVFLIMLCILYMDLKNIKHILLLLFIVLGSIGFGYLSVLRVYQWDRHIARKIRWDEEGIEIINPFSEIIRIPWEYIENISWRKYLGKKYGYRIDVHYLDKPFYTRWQFIWIDKEIGEKLLEHISNIREGKGKNESPEH